MRGNLRRKVVKLDCGEVANNAPGFHSLKKFDGVQLEARLTQSNGEKLCRWLTAGRVNMRYPLYQSTPDEEL